ncbi:MAG TPA: lysophospholipid acyltransferase family protein [Anaerolineae bacterium]|nr:lysophospholipid acyltransferase family protein [Anaerolineae bacterium]MCB0223300.1 lysophospholipid acyltransferase family protein [Anaerolineae bacterium]MCB9104103.1 lysophospholipid acyltransferase family protein [Anaerolineales bacterium]HRV94479.1 lysophospholipid acyltransferase family protein [Anaerolineae bacterium]
MTKKAKITYASPDDPLIKSIMIQAIELLSGKRRLEKLYNGLLGEHEGKPSFWGAALDSLQIKMDYDARQLAKVPRTGPVVFIANHPFGVVDGIIICHLTILAREDFQILINSSLCRAEHLTPYFLPIDFNETEEAVHVNINSKKRAIDILRDQGTIVIFPAGGIATSESPFGRATDLEWKTFAAKLIQTTQATVVPIYFHGQNSRIFQIASQFSLTLRLSLIVREVNKQIGSTIRITIGDPIPYRELSDIKKKKELTRHLRRITYELGAQSEKKGRFQNRRGWDLSY